VPASWGHFAGGGQVTDFRDHLANDTADVLGDI
jgi:hypothetical protein